MKISLITLAAVAALAAAPSHAAIIVSMNPAQQSVAVGDQITVDIRISGLGSEILSAFDLDVLFDPSLVSPGGSITLFSSEFGDPDVFVDGGFNVGNHWALAGSLLDDDDLAALQTDESFLFLSFSWTAAADGAFVVNFGPDLDFQRNIVGRNALSLDATFEGTCVAIGQGSCANRVPEPASYGLAALALLGCWRTSTRLRRQG